MKFDVDTSETDEDAAVGHGGGTVRKLGEEVVPASSLFDQSNGLGDTGRREGGT